MIHSPVLRRLRRLQAWRLEDRRRLATQQRLQEGIELGTPIRADRPTDAPNQSEKEEALERRR